jgi:hypothetical protein
MPPQLDQGLRQAKRRRRMTKRNVSELTPESWVKARSASKKPYAAAAKTLEASELRVLTVMQKSRRAIDLCYTARLLSRSLTSINIFAEASLVGPKGLYSRAQSAGLGGWMG